jgi:hypothetical protein
MKNPMKNPTSDVSRLPSSRKRQKRHKTTPPPSPVEAIWNELCSWMVSQTLRETSEMTQETDFRLLQTDFRLLPALLEHFWGKDFPCPAPFLQALTVRLMQHGPLQRQRKQHPRLRERLFSALLRLDAGRGLVLPFVEACLPHENHPEVLAGLIKSWPPGLVCPETIWQQLCKKTRPPVNADKDNGARQNLRQLAWQALFQLPAPETDQTGSPPWLFFLRQQLKFETSYWVLESIWRGVDQLGMWPTSAGERAAWLAELERHSRLGSKASDRFVTRGSLLREAIIWRVLFGMHVPAAETDASVLSRELLSRYLSNYLNCLKTPCLCHEDYSSLILLLKTMAMLPAMEHDRRAWLATWEETGAMTGVSSVSRKAFWEVMVRAQEAGLYPAEETMEAAIRALGSETDYIVFSTAASWVPPAGRLQKLWSDVWEPHLFDTFSEMAWRAWRPATDGYETFCSRLTETPARFRRMAPGYLLRYRYHRTEMTQERWHAWWAQWVRQESDPDTLEELSYAMRNWQPLPEVILSAWLERGQGGERYARVRWLAWRVLVSQPVDLSRDIIRHLPCETDRTVLETMAGWSPAATPVPAAFWEGWGKKFATLSSSSDDDSSFLLDPLVICCLKWRPANPDQIQEMWKMWEQIVPHCPTDRVKDILKVLSHAPFLAPPASPHLLNLVAKGQYGFDDIVRILSNVYKGSAPSEGEWMEKISSFTGNISNPLWWEQQAEDMISQAAAWGITAHPEGKNCLKSFQWICEQSPARGRGLLPGWNTLRPVLEKQSALPGMQLFFFSLVRKWGSPEGWQAWWEMAAAMENRDHFVIPGGCCGMIRRVYWVERLAASVASCGEGADGATLRWLYRDMKRQWWRAEDVKLWQWLDELVEKAGAAGEGPGFRQTGSAVLSDRIWPLGSGLPAWEFRSTSGQVSDFHPARQASLFS